ncbi:MAG: polyphosphate:AMP phosphotransferase [Clostridiales bacterium]|nr:polyphosphate:AMP phosphotransferase [Clostridiales bacterium]
MLNAIDFNRRMTDVEYRLETRASRDELANLQHRMKDAGLPVIVLFEGWDSSGKGSMIASMIQTLDPRFFKVYTTTDPTPEEQRFPFLWRHWYRTPERGKMAIFDESWYPEVSRARIEDGLSTEDAYSRMDSINTFERQLAQDGYLIIKFFLHISAKEQARRHARLLSDKNTRWRVSERDKFRNKHYKEYYRVYDEMLEKTNTVFAPWHVISAMERRSAMNDIYQIIVDSIRSALEEKKMIVPSEYHSQVHNFHLVKQPKLEDVPLYRRLEDSAYRDMLRKEQKKLSKLHNIIYREKIPVVIAYEGWDAAGKGGNIKRLTAALDPRGYEVVPIASPTPIDKAHQHLWRFWQNLPESGHITVFDRTWYGRVMVERLEGFCSEEEWKRAYQELNEFEYELEKWGAILIKFWLHIDSDEQLRRFTERQNTPEKQWKITDEDWRNREKWDQYEVAVNDMVRLTSTEYAPWTIIESQDKKFGRIKAIQTLNDAIEARL